MIWHYIVNTVIGLLVGFGAVELVVFLAAVFIAPSEFDWDDE